MGARGLYVTKLFNVLPGGGSGDGGTLAVGADDCFSVGGGIQIDTK